SSHSMSDEDDYMSDVFTKNITEPQVPLRPGASKSRKRPLEKTKNDEFKIKPKKAIEHESRERGLTTAIGQDNKGFKMMAMMGYKTGEGLGKSGEGRTEPVPISLKSSRSGLGKEKFEEQKLIARKKMRIFMLQQRAKVENSKRVDFRSRMSEKFAAKLVERDLGKSQTACQELDMANEYTEPLINFYWPEKWSELEDEEPEVEEYTVTEKLVMLTDYLRTEYFYCIWCATKYNDQDDLEMNCPGDTALSHD
uniref:G patch domain-containing protein 11 n=1 Tax=Ciona savignyi TaxID=51511 RepID=H2YXF6_CIOSA